jgi:Pectinacetylesterase
MLRATAIAMLSACSGVTPSSTSHDSGGDAPTQIPLPAQYTKTLLDPALYPTALCNDGTPAGYYPVAGSATTTDWILFLPGGYACGTDAECAARAVDLTTSSGWPATMTGAGVTATTAADNPHFADFNKVVIPYCTSDYFSGDTGPTGGTTNFQFRGKDVVDAVVTELTLHYGLGASGQTVLLSGASAGGVSVLVNADRVAAMIPQAHLVGLVDAGWLPDVAPLTPPSFRTTIQTWMTFWNGHPDDSCAAAEADQSFLCYFGEHVRAEITTPLMIVQNQNDPEGISHTGNITVGSGLTTAQTTWINDIYSPAVHAGLAAITATTGVFSTCDVVHTLTDSTRWTTTIQGGVALDDAAAAFFTATPALELPDDCKLPANP